MGVPGFGLLLLASRAGLGGGQDQNLALLGLLGLLGGGLGLLLFTAGVALYTLAPVFRPSLAGHNYAGYATILGCLYLADLAGLVASGLFLLVAMLTGRGGVVAGPDLLNLRGQLRSSGFLIAAALAQELAFLGILYLRIVRPGLITWQNMGLSARGLGACLALGLPTAGALLATIGIVAYLLSLLGVQQTQQQEFAALRSASPIEFALLLVVVGLLTGLAEESFFRGYVFRALYLERGPLHAYLASAFIFAGAHLDWRAFLPLFAGGLLLAFVFRRTGSIIPGVVAHAVNNSLTLAVLYFHMA